MLRRLLVALALLVVSAAPLRAETGEIRVALGYGFSYLPIMVADAKGMFAASGRALGAGEVKVVLHRFNGSPAINEALLSNTVDVAAYGAPGLLIAWDKTRGKFALKGLCGLSLAGYVLNVNKKSIKSLGDFRPDDKIAVPAPTSPQAIVLRMAAERHFGAGQWGRLDKLLVSLSHPDATTAMLAGGTITAYLSTAPFTQILAKDARIHTVMTSKEVFEGGESTGAAIGAGQRFVEANPTVARSFVAAIDDAVRFIEAEPRAAAEIYLASERSTLSLDETEQMLRDGSTIYSVAPSGMMAYAEFMARTGLMTTTPSSWRDFFFPFVHDRAGS